MADDEQLLECLVLFHQPLQHLHQIAPPVEIERAEHLVQHHELDRRGCLSPDHLRKRQPRAERDHITLATGVLAEREAVIVPVVDLDTVILGELESVVFPIGRLLQQLAGNLPKHRRDRDCHEFLEARELPVHPIELPGGNLGRGRLIRQRLQSRFEPVQIVPLALRLRKLLFGGVRGGGGGPFLVERKRKNAIGVFDFDRVERQCCDLALDRARSAPRSTNIAVACSTVASRSARRATCFCSSSMRATASRATDQAA